MSSRSQAALQLGKQAAYEGHNAFISFLGKLPPGQEESPTRAETYRSDGSRLSDIDGQHIAIKDNICSKDLATTCGSANLDGFHSPYDADVAKRLQDGGATVMGKTNLDEFGMGSNSTHSHFGPVSNAHATHLSAGGSSGGSAVAVANCECFAALGTDTGGSVRLPAAYNGVLGFKPSYGLLSRWGVIAYANSLDTVGILARNITDVRKVFETLRNPNEHDPTLMSHASRLRTKLPDGKRKHRTPDKLRIGVPSEYNTQDLQPLVREAWSRTLQDLQNAGHTICAISLPATKLALSAYYVLAPAEASSNLAKYDGVRYGNRLHESAALIRGRGDVLFSKTRGQGLGDEVRRRILLGTYSLSAGAIDNYFIQAQRIRRLVQQDFDRVFTFTNPLVDSKAQGSHRGAQLEGMADNLAEINSLSQHEEQARVDFIVAPTAQSLPPLLTEVQERDHIDAYSTDVLTVPASLAGLPAISIPVPVPDHHQANARPVTKVGIQVIGQVGTDEQLLDAAKRVEEIYDSI